MNKSRFLLFFVFVLLSSVGLADNFDNNLRTEENGLSYYNGSALYFGIATYAPDRYSLGNDYSAGVEYFYFEYVRADTNTTLADYVAANSDQFQLVSGTNRSAYVDTSRTINGQSSTRNFFAFTVNEDGTVEPLVDYIKVRKNGNYYKSFLGAERVDQGIFAPDSLAVLAVDPNEVKTSFLAQLIGWLMAGLLLSVYILAFFFCFALLCKMLGVKFSLPQVYTSEQKAVDRELIKRGALPQYDLSYDDSIDNDREIGLRRFYSDARQYIEEDFDKDMKAVFRDRNGKKRSAKQVAKQIEFLRTERERNLLRISRAEIEEFGDDIDVDEDEEVALD